MKHLKFLLPIFFISIFLHAQSKEDIEKKIMAAEKAKQTEAKQAKHIVPVPTQELKGVIVIEPRARAQDYASAFEILKKSRSSSHIHFHMADGKILSNVSAVTPMKNGTLVIFTFASSQGIQHMIVPIEDIVALTHS